MRGCANSFSFSPLAAREKRTRKSSHIHNTKLNKASFPPPPILYGSIVTYLPFFPPFSLMTAKPGKGIFFFREMEGRLSGQFRFKALLQWHGRGLMNQNGWEEKCNTDKISTVLREYRRFTCKKNSHPHMSTDRAWYIYRNLGTNLHFSRKNPIGKSWSSLAIWIFFFAHE